MKMPPASTWKQSAGRMARSALIAARYQWSRDGKAHRPGLFQCRDAVAISPSQRPGHGAQPHPADQVGLAFHLMAASKKGTAHQLHRMLEVTYKTAWFMATASARRCAKKTRSAGRRRQDRGGGRSLPRQARDPAHPQHVSPGPRTEAWQGPPRSARSSPWWSVAARPAPRT